jgi:hypothetical protein
MRVSWLLGVILAILIPVAFSLFGVLRPIDALAAMFLLNGIWAIAYGVSLAVRDRLYYSGWGLILLALSSFAFVRFEFTLGLVVVAIIVMVFVYIFTKPTRRGVPPIQRPAYPS